MEAKSLVLGISRGPRLDGWREQEVQQIDEFEVLSKVEACNAQLSW